MDPLYSIIYPTSRKIPHLDWFLDSLQKQASDEELRRVQLIVVDRFSQENGRYNWFVQHKGLDKFHSVVRTPVKPCTISGKYRLTSKDWFAASAFRNTGILLADADHLVFVDDLSIVTPGWWDSVKKSREQQKVYFGTYAKHRKMIVKDGEIVSSDPWPGGADTRLQISAETRVCTGSWMFGCSVAVPTEAMLQINGFDEDADTMGGEDYAAGMMLERRGWECVFCVEMKTIESDEDHEVGEVLPRLIKEHPDPNQKDFSHIYLEWIKSGQRDTAAFYNNRGLSLRDARKQVRKTRTLPECSIPEHDWRDGQPFSEM